MKFFFTHLSILFLSVFIASYSYAERLNGFDVSNLTVDKKGITHGGPPRDGIPAIDNPKFIAIKEAGFLSPDDVVLGLEIDNQAFAFPRHIMNWHEIINVNIDESYFVVSYCPLCGTGIAFLSKIDKEIYTFGVSGLLFNSDLLLYDRATESLWSQIDAKSISGKLAGKTLTRLPLSTTTWSSWAKSHPKTLVLDNEQGFKRNYRHDPYSGYDTSSHLFFDVLREAPKEFHTKERVLGIKIGEKAKAYPFKELREHAKEQFIDNIDGKNIVIEWNEESDTASIRDTETKKLLVSTVAYWFAWYNFNPETQIFRAKK